jgi:hypothetical protein
MPHDDALTAALARQSETEDVDFKASFDAASARDWLELIKDIVAFANSGGGHILVGLNDDGTPSGSDVSSLLAVDPADLGNRLYKFTGQHFAGVELVECEKAGNEVCAVHVSPARVPIVFTRSGKSSLMERRRQHLLWERCIFVTVLRVNPAHPTTCGSS